MSRWQGESDLRETKGDIGVGENGNLASKVAQLGFKSIHVHYEADTPRQSHQERKAISHFTQSDKHEDMDSEGNYILKTKQDKIYGVGKKHTYANTRRPTQNWTRPVQRADLVVHSPLPPFLPLPLSPFSLFPSPFLPLSSFLLPRPPFPQVSSKTVKQVRRISSRKYASSVLVSGSVRQ